MREIGVLHPQWFIVLLILLLAGLANSIYLTYHHYKVNILHPSAKSFCVLSKTIDCDRVARGVGSTFIGIPVATLGMFTHWFLLLLILSELFLKLGIQEVLYCVMYSILLLMVLFSTYEAFISFVILKAVCIMCVVLYFTIGFMLFACKQVLGVGHGEILEVIRGLLFVSISQDLTSKVMVCVCLAVAFSGALAFVCDYGFRMHFKRLIGRQESDES
jgi:uncharacterized membrane protein